MEASHGPPSKMSSNDEVDFKTFNVFLDEERRSSISLPQDAITKQYYLDLQTARYEDFTSLKPNTVFADFGDDSEKRRVIALFAANFPEPEEMKKLFFYFITKMDTVVDRPYHLIFFNSGVGSFKKRQVVFLREAFMNLPKKYSRHLQGLYIVHPTFMMNLYFWFTKGTWEEQIEGFSAKKHNVDDPKSMKLLKNLLTDWQKLIPENLASAILGKKHDKKDKDAHVPVPVMKQVFGCALEDYPVGPESPIPRIILLLASYFEANPNALKTEYIFRIPAAITELQRIESALLYGEDEKVLAVKDPNVIAELFKKVFRDLKPPLFPHDDFEKIRGFHRMEKNEKESLIHEMINGLPNLQKTVFMYVMNFFLKVLSYGSYNRMEASYISIVFAPNMIRPVTFASNDLTAASNPSQVMTYILTNKELFIQNV